MVVVGLMNPKDAGNVGSVLRALGCFAADSVFYTGSRYDCAAKHRTDTKKVGAQGDRLHKVECLTLVRSRLPASARMVCVELVVGATPLTEFVHPEHAFYVFGPEDGSLSAEVVQAADEVVYIPTVGCLNLAATVNVVLYDRLLKRGTAAGVALGDDLIVSSRDNRNRLVKR
ncbi:MAG: RNA methyltransferase [Bacterioplanes sp.]|nr:RNA methyltransferase [Bacterioplanes sp.]